MISLFPYLNSVCFRLDWEQRKSRHASRSGIGLNLAIWSPLLVSNAYGDTLSNFFFKCVGFYFYLVLTEYIFLGEGLTNISSVVESGLGLPTPEELVRDQSMERSANDSAKAMKVGVFFCCSSHFVLLNLVLL